MKAIPMLRRRGLAALAVLWPVLPAACSPGSAAQAPVVETTEQMRVEPEPAQLDTLSAMRLSTAFRGAANRALPAVVSIEVLSTRRVTRSSQPRIFRFFPDFPGMPEFDEEQLEMPVAGRGSGFIFDTRGYIMTNRHVVADAEEVAVTLSDGREYNATVVGTDPMTDVAVIQIEPGSDETLPRVEFGDSEAMQVGDWVLALGNPLGLDFTVTAGIVSAKGRQTGILRQRNETALEAFIQTDAAINRGNSGGPLVDLRGRVVGINTAIQTPTGYYAGYGFAIPADLARRVAEDLIEYGTVRRPRLGVAVSAVTPADAEAYGLKSLAGAHVAQVQPNTPAERAGLEIGDVIIRLDDEPVEDATALTMALAQREPGDRVELTVFRDGDTRTIEVELGQFETEPARDRDRDSRREVEEVVGFRTEPLTPEFAQRYDLDADEGVVVSGVVPYSPAANAGIGEGLVVLRMNGEEVDSPEDVERIAESIEPGDVISLIVRAPNDEAPRIINYRTRR